MKLLPVTAVLIASLASCAPILTGVIKPPTPVLITTNVRYTTGIPKAGEDNPVLAAIVAIAPSVPVTGSNRQPWRAEDIQSNGVALRSHPKSINPGVFSLDNLDQEMSWNVITSSGVTTVSAVYSSAYQAVADDLFRKLDAQFSRVK